MGKIPDELRVTIARNIRNCREKMFPGRGGAKKCAELFGVAPQQWSPWERGVRTPDELRLARLAEFFQVTVEWLRRDHSEPEPRIGEKSAPSTSQPPSGETANPVLPSPDLFSYLYQHRMKAVYRVEVMVTGMHFVPIHPV